MISDEVTSASGVFSATGNEAMRLKFMSASAGPVTCSPESPRL
jgi:hypothetical protein